MKSVAGIYKLVHKPTGKIYIGQTRQFNVRLYEHKKSYNGEARVQKWMIPLLESVETPDFNADFEFELLEEVNDQEERNVREKYYINLYRKQYGDAVANISNGGYYKPKSEGRTYRTAKAPIARSKIVLVYDTNTDTVEMYPSIKAVSEELQLTFQNATICYEWLYAAKHRYYLLSISPVDRYTSLNNYITSQKQSLDRVIELRDRANIVVISRRSNETAENMKRAEILISKHFSYLSCDCILQKIISIADEAVHYFTQYLKVWAARHSVHGDTIETSQEEVILYSTKKGVVGAFPDVNSAMEYIGLNVKYPFSRIGQPNPMLKEYYIYYADNNLRRAMLDVVRYNCASIIRLNDKHINPNTMYQYMCGYYAVSKALGDPIATL